MTRPTSPTPPTEPTGQPGIAEFDLTGPLPTGTTVLEASAGTGKTFALAGLVTRMVAEGHAVLDEMLLITFGRAASQELRERVRAQLVQAEAALADPGTVDEHSSALLRHLVAAETDVRHRRVRDALADFDAATIATTHQFCQIVLRSLGVAGDNDAGVRLVEDLDELLTEVVDDLYLARFASPDEPPPFGRSEALTLVRAAAGNPHTRLRPDTGARVDFTRAALTELERRKRRLGILGYDDLLTRLADALEDPDAPARARMRRRWKVVMVDEFQDTDPVQWKVIDRAFSGHATLILIGDPKQAIYAFRGGDIATYLEAARTAGRRLTLGTNWRSDRPLVDALGAVLGGAALGHRDIVVHPVRAHRRWHRLAGAPHNDPFRLRVVDRAPFRVAQQKTVAIDLLREHIATDLAGDISALLACPDATFDGKRVGAGDIAVIVDAHKDARAVKRALDEAGIPSVYTGDSGVFGSEAADDWLTLLEAFEQPHRTGLVRAAAATAFFGRDAADLAAGGEALTEDVADILREWSSHLARRGVAAVFEAAKAEGMADRVLSVQGGERRLTDLAHLSQLMHEAAQRQRLSLTGLIAWLRAEREGGSQTTERMRRLDSDAAAVQIMTVWVSKGLQFPVVYLPFSFDRYVKDRDVVPLFHDEADRRCLDVGGQRRDDEFSDAMQRFRAEERASDLRLAYVALTRAQSQVVAWWAPSWNERNSGLSRLLRGRNQGEAEPAELRRGPTDHEAVATMRAWEAAGGPVVERSEIAEVTPLPAPTLPDRLAPRRFERTVDTAWRRTSYSGILRTAAERVAPGVSTEPEEAGVDDEPETEAADPPAAEPDPAPSAPVSPMADLPAGATFGSLVHGVLEHADPDAADLHAELLDRIEEQRVRWPVDLDPDELARALVAVTDTPLGDLAAGRTLREIPLADRMAELDFEIPLAGGDLLAEPPDVRLREVAGLLRRRLPATDPFHRYADRVEEAGLGDQSLRGYLSGSIDALLRVRIGEEDRFLVVDYKTNRLPAAAEVLTAADYAPPLLAEAMLHSDYPLQALLYSVVAHRYLRWRVPGYDPAVHLGGVLYLYVRGMCGPETPVHDGPAGVFAWRPPDGLVEELSLLLAGEGTGR